MYSARHRSTSTESIASEATSRVTTIPDSLSDTKLGRQQTPNHSHQIFNPRTEDDRSSTSSSISTVASQKLQGLKTNDNQVNKVTPRSQQQQEPWVNPYWGSKTNDNQVNKVTAPNKQQQEPWVNPYWGSKANQTDSQSIQKENTMENKQSTSTSTATDQKDQQLQNEKPQNLTSSNQQENKTWQNPYWKNKNIPNQDTTVSVWKKATPHEKDVQVPPFYELIYPKHTPLSSSVSIVNSKNETVSPTELSTRNVNGYDNSSSNSQHPVLPSHTSNSVPFSQMTNVVSTPKTDTSALVSQTFSLSSSSLSNNTTSPPSMNLAKYPLATSSAAALTEEELEAVQNALHLLETNPNAIRVVQSQQRSPPSNTGLHNNLPSPIAGLFSGNQQQPAQHQQSPPSNAGLHKNMPSPIAGLFSGNQQQQPQQQKPPSSNTGPPNNMPSSTAGLFSGNQQQPPPSNSGLYNNMPSSTAGLFSGNQQQQPQQQPPSSNTGFHNNKPSPIAGLFSGNQQQQPPTSNGGHHSNIPSTIAGLFSGNQQQPPPSNTRHQTRPPSPLSLLYFRQEPRRQPATTSSSFSQNIQLSYPSYRHSSNSPQTYPSNISESIRKLTAPGSVVYI